MSATDKPAAKTAAERMRAMRARRAEAELKELRLMAHPDDHEAIREHAAKLAAKRGKAARKTAKPT